MARSLLAAPALVALVLTTGCQSKPKFTFAPVEGTITRGGQPLSGVVVIFWGDTDSLVGAPHASGATDASGHYRLHTDQGESGAVPGPYRVCIVDQAELMNRVISRNPTVVRLSKDATRPEGSGLPPSYTRRTETPLRAQVQPGGEQVIDLEVK
jgi:hypothetical protein